MGNSFKNKLSSRLVLSPQMNRLVLQMKASWDEVEGILKGREKKKKKCNR